METGNLKIVKHTVRYKLNKDDPAALVEFDTSEAANGFALHIETNGGIALVGKREIEKQMLPARLIFDDWN